MQFQIFVNFYVVFYCVVHQSLLSSDIIIIANGDNIEKVTVAEVLSVGISPSATSVVSVHESPSPSFK